MPHNFNSLGLITTLFPNARIIHITRNPLDCCLSNFQQVFTYGNYFSFSLESLAHYFITYRDYMEYWQEALPHPFHTVAYENLVTNQRQAITEALDYLGLPWDDACLEHHKHMGNVMTASAWQVRQKVYTTSQEKWRHYASHLAPLAKQLETAGIKTGWEETTPSV